jgi:hypothetical protein
LRTIKIFSPAFTPQNLAVSEIALSSLSKSSIDATLFM